MLSFARKCVAKNFQKSPNLVSLVPIEIKNNYKHGIHHHNSNDNNNKNNYKHGIHHHIHHHNSNDNNNKTTTIRTTTGVTKRVEFEKN